MPSGSAETQLKFYEYKWIRQLLIDIIAFQKKNSPDGMMIDHKESIPYFVYNCDPNYLKMLVDKMTKRMEEFEPWISKNTTAHTGYWDV
jgi:hypothetical protein